VLDSVYPDVGTAYAFTRVELYGHGLSMSLATLGCRFGETVVALTDRATLSVACSTPSAGPGFVAVGFAHTTGKPYAPGRDDISRERGYNVFQFVEPWKLSTIFPQETQASGGQKLFLTGRNVRPETRCNFGGQTPGKSVSLEFVSSALAVCEAESTPHRSTGVLMLQHESHATPDGQRVTMRYRRTPDISYIGRDSPTIGEDVSFVASATDESVERILSWDARLGCQFGGVWVSAVGHVRPSEIRCVVPASAIGRTQVTVSDLHSLTPLPSVNGTRAAADVANSGRFSLSVRKPVAVHAVIPTAGSQIGRDANEGVVDVFGDHLGSHLGALASFCVRLSDTTLRFVDRATAREEVRARCLVALASGWKSGTERAFRVGFNAVSIAGALTRGQDTTVQYLLQAPPRLFSTTTAAVREGDVVFVVGENFEDSVRGVWCATGAVSEPGRVVSSALVRCDVNIGEDIRGAFGAASTGQVKLGVSSGAATTPSASHLASVIWLSNPPEVGSLTPDVGFSEGGTRVIVAPRGGGLSAARFHALATTCRFGSIAPVSASSIGADTMECTAPALAPGAVAFGAPYLSGITEAEVRYRVVDGSSVIVSTTTTATTPFGGVAHFIVVRAATQPLMTFGCTLSASRGDPIPAAETSGHSLTCAFPASGPGFTVLDVTLTSSRSPRVRDVAEILLARPSPPAIMVRSEHSSEVYVGDVVHLTAGGVGFSEETWCVTVVGDDELKSRAHWTSAAAVKCEVSSTRDDEDRALLDATMDACAAHACGLSTGTAAPTRDAGRLVLGAEKTVLGVIPTRGSTAGGTAMRIRLTGASLDFARRFSTCHVGTIGPIYAFTVGIRETMEIECVTPGRAPGAATVALVKGNGLTGDVSFAFVEDAADEIALDQYDTRAASSPPGTSACDDAVLLGDIEIVGEAWSASDGGAEISLSTGSTTPRPTEACAAHWTACRVGTTWPVLGHLTELGIECVAPAHKPGVVDVSAPKMRLGAPSLFTYRRRPSLGALDQLYEASRESFALAVPRSALSTLAVTLNWRDASFAPFEPLLGGTRLLRTFRFDLDEYTAKTVDDAADETRPSSAPPPSLANVVPWLAWGGNVLHVTGRNIPADASAACMVGTTLAPASSVSSALILCDPFPVPPSPTASRLAGGMTEISLGVASTTAPRRVTDATALSVFVLDLAAVVGVDAGYGWEQGGGSVRVELSGWAPTGWMDCRFGTATVNSRSGGAGWRARASSGRAGEWWSEATAAADVECVTPARRTGRVMVGVSLAHSASVSYDAGVEYLYF
jgi:hypothetical protein